MKPSPLLFLALRPASASAAERKVGDRQGVTLERNSRELDLDFGGNTYACLDVAGSVPASLLVQPKVGPGDVSLADAHLMSADVGSGDVTARDIKGLATAAVGPGSLQFGNIGASRLLALGSGNVAVRDIRGAVNLGTLGAGEFVVHNAASPGVQRTGSDAVRHTGISGRIELPENQ